MELNESGEFTVRVVQRININTMSIRGLEGLSESEIRSEINKGAKFVFYLYTISIIFLTFKRPSKVYFIPARGSAVGKGFGFTILTLLFGWWGIPWGPIYSIQSVFTNLSGGKDVTSEILASLQSGNQ